ncbi:MAG: hypothetical protein DSM106950_06315 [Stigonema ocellatum SAG 48.90 = DSM 106950]|nr:hypothetical protein [Stigonema ocellatum SAG 48.90 = DSM 106950]
MSFLEIVERISHKFSHEIERTYNHSSGSIPFANKLSFAIELWCLELDIPNNINSYILQGCQIDSVKELTEFIWQEATQDKKTRKKTTLLGEFTTYFTTENELFYRLNSFFNRMKIRSGNMTLIVMLAFVVTAVGYCLYITNQPRQTQQPTRKQEPKQYEYASNPPSPLVQTITKHFLVLVISASQSNFVGSLKAKQRIDFNDGEALYKITKYLWIGSESALNQKKANLNNYLVETGGESEYDINLVYLELKQSDEGFKTNINQLDRYDAFRKLSDLVVNFSLSHRLQMEAYENFEVYNC